MKFYLTSALYARGVSCASCSLWPNRLVQRNGRIIIIILGSTVRAST